MASNGLRRRRMSTPLLLGAAATATALLTAGCGQSGTDSSAAGTTTANPASTTSTATTSSTAASATKRATASSTRSAQSNPFANKEVLVALTEYDRSEKTVGFRLLTGQISAPGEAYEYDSKDSTTYHLSLSPTVTVLGSATSGATGICGRDAKANAEGKPECGPENMVSALEKGERLAVKVHVDGKGTITEVHETRGKAPQTGAATAGRGTWAPETS